jgi:hypothetical protein
MILYFRLNLENKECMLTSFTPLNRLYKDV